MKTVAIGILGTTIDRRGNKENRWDRWRPTVSMCQHEDLIIDRLELLFDNHSNTLANQVAEDIRVVSPETEVCNHLVNFRDPWDFETVYAQLLDFARAYPFDTDSERYLIHITTGTHVAQICWYLLTEAGYLPGQLLQTAPAKRRSNSPGQYQIIDLDLSKYDQIASRFAREHEEGTTYLKGGIETANAQFNSMIEQLEQVSIRSNEPILLTGPTGAGKSQLAERVYELRKQRSKLAGNLVVVNCATLRGENAMSALFGHKRGAFTGAANDRPGLLKEAHNGLLFLDEIGELGLDEQAMLLRAIEEKRFIPLGADKEEQSDFQLIAGTNQNLNEAVVQGHFRADLLARINLWSYELPSLKERIEDIEPNIEYELDAWARKHNDHVSFNKSARQAYLNFATSPNAVWSANFRDLNASITRMATFAAGGRITEDIVDDEIQRLLRNWNTAKAGNKYLTLMEQLLGPEKVAELDYFDQAQLVAVLEVCMVSRSMAEAGRSLFNVSRVKKSSGNDSHRVRQFLAKFGLSFDDVQRARSSFTG